MRRAAAWAVGAGLVGAAWGVAALTPADDASEAPFPVSVAVGERGVGRNVAITVVDIRRASSVSAQDWSAEGNWVVVDLDAAAVTSEPGTTLRLATLETAGRTFSASERPESLATQPLAVGIPRSGSVAFELPDDIEAGEAVLTFGLSSDPRLDSLIVLQVDLDEIEVQTDAELRPTGWAQR